ncbi:MAG: ROK family protein [Sulfolobales archaeon]
MRELQGPVLAYDIGATWIRAAIVAERNGNIEILARNKVRTKGDTPEEFRENFEEVLQGIPRDFLREIKGIGIGSIGPMDLKRGILTNPPNIKAKNIDLKYIMSKLFEGKPVYLANDCVAGALGEYFYGSGRGFDNIVYITISTGIGAGVIVDGEPLVGKDGNAHEIGHLVIDRSIGIKCGCGGIGHWEGMCSGSGIPKLVEYIASKKRYEGSKLQKMLSERSITAVEVFESYYTRDPLAVEVIEECNEINAAGVASVINAYDPEIVILGGSVVLNNRWIVDEIRRRVHKYSINRLPRIEVTRFEDDIVIIGAAALILGEYNKKKFFRIV